MKINGFSARRILFAVLVVAALTTAAAPRLQDGEEPPQIGDVLGAVFLLSALNMAVVEYLSAPFKQMEKAKPYLWLLVYVSFITGVVISLSAKVNVIPLIAPAVTDPLTGLVLTALIVGIGASKLYDLLDQPRT